jgi:hypothetical protein
MPQGDKLAIGVALPIKNFSMRKGTDFSTTVSQSVVTGQTAISITGLTVNDLGYILGEGDTVRIGPSNDSTNESAIENLIISEASDSHVTLSSGAFFEYASGDKFTGVGMHMPGNWVWDIETGSGEVVPTFSNNSINRIDDDEDGVDDYYALDTVVQVGSGGIATWEFSIRQSIPTYNFIPQTYYRVGYFYKLGTGFSGSLYKLMNDGNSNFISEVQSNLNNDREWQEEVSNVQVSTTAANLDTGWIGLGIAGGSSNVDWSTTMTFDCIYAEHAKGTSADTSNLPATQLSRAVYTFEEYPDANSEVFMADDYERRIISPDGTLKTFQPDSRRSSRYTYKCSFTDGSASFFRNITKLLQWQKMGYKLILHTNESVGNVSKIPPVMMGYMTIGNISKGSWDKSKTSFTMEFTEAF